MLPLTDTENTRYGPTSMTSLIIVACFLIWIFEEVVFFLDLPVSWGLIFVLLGTSPKLILNQEGLGGLTSITAAFLHGGFSHVFFNMWALWVFGPRVEDACGPWRFLAFYLFCSATGDMAFTLIHADSWIPAIGASGAIYGVMGAYMLLYPEGRIRTLLIWHIPIMAWPRIRAFWVVLFFFVTQIAPALDVLINDAHFRTAHWGHLGGFFGALAIFFFLRPAAFQRYINHLPV